MDQATLYEVLYAIQSVPRRVQVLDMAELAKAIINLLKEKDNKIHELEEQLKNNQVASPRKERP